MRLSHRIALLPMALLIGCGPRTHDRVTVTPSEVRAARRTYDGGPPVIPHPPLGGHCANCHTGNGRMLPGLGIAPANPHLETAGIGDAANCRQCHVFVESDALFVANTFEGLPQDLREGERSYPGAPPTMPHPIFMREDCASCHTGPAARPELVCDHPERTNCMQCHIPRQTPADAKAQFTEL